MTRFAQKTWRKVAATSLIEPSMSGLVSTYDFKHKLLDGLGVNNGVTSGALASSNYSFVDTILGKMARSQNPGGICFGDGFKNQSNFFASLWYRHITDPTTGWIINQYLTDALGYGLYLIGDSLGILDDINNANATRYATNLIPGKTYHFLFGINSSDLCKLWVDSVPADNDESAADSFTSIGGNLYLCGRNLPLPLPVSRFVPGLCGPPSIFNRDMVDSDASKLYQKGAQAVQFQTDWGHKADGLTRTAPEYLGDGPFRVYEGSFKVTTDTVNGHTCKVIECVSYGHFSAPWSVFQVQGAETGYGSWAAWVYVPSGPGSLRWHIFNSAQVGGSGYFINIDGSGSADIRERGAVGDIVSGTHTPGQWNHVHGTRRYDKLFELFVNGASQGTGTDITTSSGKYISFQMTTGTKVALADKSGQHAITKYLGVVPPKVI